MYLVYIIKSLKDGSHYIGSTSDLKSRLKRHNAGHSRFTRSRTPYKVVYAENFRTRARAVGREREIKAYKGGEAFKKLINR
ncbi:MAG: GIY-YIG nuclease family protein [Patescibacteria group bacterium]